MSANMDKEIADALNTAFICNLRCATGFGALTRLITDYLCVCDVIGSNQK